MLMRMMRGLVAGLCLVGMVSAVAVETQQAKIYPQLGHGYPIDTAVFSPDGSVIISSSFDKMLKVWDVSTGRELLTLKGINDESTSRKITFSPDGHTIAANDGDTIKLWDVNSNGEPRELHTLGERRASAPAFSHDGFRVAAGGGSNVVTIWDVASGRAQQTLDLRNVKSVAFSPDGQAIVTGGDGGVIKLWDVSNGRELQTLEGHSGRVNAVAYSPDGRTIASGSDDTTLKLWDAITGRKLLTLNGNSSAVDSVTFSPDGQSITSHATDGSIKFWKTANGVNLGSETGNFVSPDGLTIASGKRSIDLRDTKSRKQRKSLGGETLPVLCVTVAPNGKTLVIGRKLFDAATGRQLHALEGSTFAYSPDSRTIASASIYIGSDTKSINLWDVVSGKKIRTLRGHNDQVTSVAFSPDGLTIASSSNDKTIKLWSSADGRELRSLIGHVRAVNSVAYSPDSRSIISGSSDHGLTLWDVASGREIRTMTGHISDVNSVAFSPDGHTIVSGSNDHTTRLWDTTSGRELQTLQSHSRNTQRNEDVTPERCDEKGCRIFISNPTGDAVKAVAFSPDGHAVASGSSGNSIELWNITSGKLHLSLNGHENEVNTLVFFPDGKKMISGSSDGTARIWDVTTGKELAKFVSFNDGEWVTITSEGYFDASEHGDKHLNVRIGEGLHEVYGIDQYRESFYRPDLVKIALGGGSLKDFRNIATVKASPQVAIVDTPASTSDSETKVTVKLTDMGGGIGDVRLYLNGSAVLLDNSRALKRVTTNDGKSVTRTYTVKLSNGKNALRAIAFNDDNSMQSTDALYEINASIKVASKPTLHAIIVGIQEFKNPKLKLSFPVADADLFADTLTKSASGLFGKVDIKKLTTREETTSENIRKELTALRSLNPDDLFVFYVASHGTVDDGEYFLITSNVGPLSTDKLKSDALRQNELKELIANIPTTKKVIVLDTCNSGALSDVMLTRGMSEDTAIKILSRAVGSTILSASTSSQEALEGYKGHGLFTFVLSEGLSGKADKGKSGFIKTTDLADYVESEVPEIAEKIFKRAQYPTKTISGQGFHIGKVR